MWTKLILGVCAASLLVIAGIEYRNYREAHPTHDDIRQREDSLARALFEKDTAVNAYYATILKSRADSNSYAEFMAEKQGITKSEAWAELTRPVHRNPDAAKAAMRAENAALDDSMSGRAFRGQADSVRDVRKMEARGRAAFEKMDSLMKAMH